MAVKAKDIVVVFGIVLALLLLRSTYIYNPGILSGQAQVVNVLVGPQGLQHISMECIQRDIYNFLDKRL